MAKVLDMVVVQLTQSGGSATERIVAKQLADNGDPENPVVDAMFCIDSDNLPAPEKTAYDTLIAYLQAQLDAV